MPHIFCYLCPPTQEDPTASWKPCCLKLSVDLPVSSSGAAVRQEALLLPWRCVVRLGWKSGDGAWRPTDGGEEPARPPPRSGWEAGPWEAAAAVRCPRWLNRPAQTDHFLERVLKESAVGKNWNVSVITVPECPPILWIMAVSYHSPELIEISISVYALEYFLRF